MDKHAPFPGDITMLKLAIAWPDRVLHPNARSHWSAKAKAAKKARAGAAWEARVQWGKVTMPDGPIAVHLEFCPPDRRRRDLDGCLSSIKPHLDGIADALGVDDNRFQPTLRMGEPYTGGMVRVVVEVRT